MHAYHLLYICGISNYNTATLGNANDLNLVLLKGKVENKIQNLLNLKTDILGNSNQIILTTFSNIDSGLHLCVCTCLQICT